MMEIDMDIFDEIAAEMRQSRAFTELIPKSGLPGSTIAPAKGRTRAEIGTITTFDLPASPIPLETEESRAVRRMSTIACTPGSNNTPPTSGEDAAIEDPATTCAMPHPTIPAEAGRGAVIVSATIDRLPPAYISPSGEAVGQTLCDNLALAANGTNPSQEGANEALKSSAPIMEMPRSQKSRRKVGETGHVRADSHYGLASLDSSAQADGGGQWAYDARLSPAPATTNDEGGRPLSDTQCASAPLVASIAFRWRQRQRWHRAEKALILQAKALCRAAAQGDKKVAATFYDGEKNEVLPPAPLVVAVGLEPFIAAISNFRPMRLAIEKSLEKDAKKLPAWKWANDVRGLGALTFAGIVGETATPDPETGQWRDIGDYKSPAALWKRMGLAVINGERQRKCKDADKAIEHGYNANRRSLMWNVGGGVIGGMGKGPRPKVGEDIALRDDWTYYQKLFVERVRYEADRDNRAGWREPVVHKDTGELRESYSLAAAARAKRYVEKRLLKHLWQLWRGQERVD